MKINTKKRDFVCVCICVCMHTCIYMCVYVCLNYDECHLSGGNELVLERAEKWLPEASGV